MNHTAFASDVDTSFDIDIERPKTKPRRPRDPREWGIVREYERQIVPEHTSSGIDGGPPDYDGRGRLRFAKHGAWWTRPHPMTDREIHAALFRRDRLTACGVERVTFLTLDVDCHTAADDAEKPVRVPVGTSINDCMRANSPPANAKRRRTAVRDAGWSTVQALLARVPGAVATMTKRGYHVLVMLSAALPVAEVEAMGNAIIADISTPEGVTIEVFPKVGANGLGRTAALPLTGPARIVASDGLTREHRRRVDDVLFLLGHATRHDREDLPTGTRLPAVPVERPALPPRPPLRLVDDRDPMGQRWGDEFAAQVEDRVLTRVRNDESWQACAKLAAIMVYLAIPAHIANAAFEAWLHLPEHEADHFRCESGRKALRRAWKSFRQRREHAIAAGHVVPGRMKPRSIKRRIYELAGVALPQPGLHKQQVPAGLFASAHAKQAA